jgi:oligoribonuclease (3'-5' exoribonuclease)
MRNRPGGNQATWQWRLRAVLMAAAAAGWTGLAFLGQWVPALAVAVLCGLAASKDME